MPTNEPWTVAANLTSLLIQKLTRATNGAFSVNGSAYQCVGILDRFGHEDEVQSENIKPVTSTRRNEVPLTTGTSMRITTLRNSRYGQVLENIKRNAGWCLVTYAEGTETIGPGYFSVGNLSRGTDGEGRQTITLELRPCDPGQEQVPYATTQAP